MECITKNLTFKVTRKTPELITPAGPTPHDFKILSDIDDQDSLRLVQPPLVIFYKGSPSMHGKDPVEIVRRAIAKSLIFYYPFAGRLREIGTRKLMVECTAEGVLFVEADANVTLEQLVDAGLHPPFQYMDQLFYNFPNYDGIFDSPLIFFQVTRLKCGGFIFAYHFPHVMADGAGILQFVSAIGELACGGDAPSVPPVWERHLLNARIPPCVSLSHPEYLLEPDFEIPPEDMVECSFFFSAKDISTLRCSLPPQHRSCSQFDIVSACVWRCRAAALYLNTYEEVKLMFMVSIGHILHPPLPTGYYGNAIAVTLAVATTEEISKNPLDYIIELVRKAKAKVTDKYVKSTVDLIGSADQTCFNVDRTFVVSDLSRYPYEKVDFGWGKGVYGGVAKSGPYPIHGALSWFIPFKNNRSENGILVPISLPSNAMQVFKEELRKTMEIAQKATISNASAL